MDFSENELKILIENEDSESRKQGYLLKLFDKLKLNKLSFRYIEELFISEPNSLIRLVLLKFLCNSFPERAIEPINWVLEKELSFFKYLFSNFLRINNEIEFILKITKNKFLRFILQNREQLSEHNISFSSYNKALIDRDLHLSILERESFKSDQFNKSKKFEFTQIRKNGKLRFEQEYYIPIYQEPYSIDTTRFYLIHYNLFNTISNLMCNSFSLNINDFRFFLEERKTVFMMINKKCELITLFNVKMRDFYRTSIQRVHIEEY